MASSDNRTVKRFIAGAKCPRCGAVDKIYVLKSKTASSRHCNGCDFGERLEDPAPPSDGGIVGDEQAGVPIQLK